MAHRTTVRVRFYELDPYNHVNHSVYFSYFETARIEALASIGYDLQRLKREGFHLVVAEANARFVRSAAYGDELVINTELVEVRRVGSRWRQTATLGDEVVATVEIHGAITDEEGRPVRTPSEFQEALEAFRD
jgi:acyl-CoA thioester hydrolase